MTGRYALEKLKTEIKLLEEPSHERKEQRNEVI